MGLGGRNMRMDIEDVLNTYLRVTKYVANKPDNLKDDRKRVKKMLEVLNSDGDMSKYLEEDYEGYTI